LHKNCNTTDLCFYTICGVATHTVYSPEITLILQPTPIDVEIGPAGAHGNRLIKSAENSFILL